MRNTILILSLMLLCGCWGNDVKPDEGSNIVFHPELPRSVRVTDFNWVVVKIDGESVVYLPLDEFISYRKEQADILRYMRSINAVVCYYRDKNKNEPICELINKEK